MNIHETVTILRAGGPGSGRHAIGGNFKQTGFVKSQSWMNPDVTHYDDGKGNHVEVSSGKDANAKSKIVVSHTTAGDAKTLSTKSTSKFDDKDMADNHLKNNFGITHKF